MRKHWCYFLYVVRHRWYVLQECWKRGLYWRGLIHDLSKLRPSEWIAYCDHFYSPNKKKWKDKTGYYRPTPSDDPAFDLAWLYHQHRNDHHHQFWLLREDDGGTIAVEMPMNARVELLCDWVGAGKAQGFPDTKAWYLKNREKMILGPETRKWIEKELQI